MDSTRCAARPFMNFEEDELRAIGFMLAVAIFFMLFLFING